MNDLKNYYEFNTDKILINGNIVLTYMMKIFQNLGIRK